MNIFQAIFWAFQCQRLVNKLMSKDYAEYSLIQRGPPPKESPINQETEIEEKEILDQLNAMISA